VASAALLRPLPTKKATCSAQHDRSGHHSEAPCIEPDGGECVTGGTGPRRYDSRVITNRLGCIQKKIPDHCPGIIIGGPGCAAFGDARIMRWSPVVQGHVRVSCQMTSFGRSGARCDPSDKARSVPLPDRMENTRPWPALGIHGGDAGPHDLVSHLDKGWCNFRKAIHTAIVLSAERRNHKKRKRHVWKSDLTI
jgi:hypothetical protein